MYNIYVYETETTVPPENMRVFFVLYGQENVHSAAYRFNDFLLYYLYM